MNANRFGNNHGRNQAEDKRDLKTINKKESNMEGMNAAINIGDHKNKASKSSNDSQPFGKDLTNMKMWVPVGQSQKERKNIMIKKKEIRVAANNRKGRKGPTYTNKEGSPFTWANNPFEALVDLTEHEPNENHEPNMETDEIESVKPDKHVMNVMEGCSFQSDIDPQGQKIPTDISQ